jgi:hypothetical protein
VTSLEVPVSNRLPIAERDKLTDIAGLTEKPTPIAGDWLLVEDSAAANIKKKVQVGNLPAGGGGLSVEQATGTSVAVATGFTEMLSINVSSQDILIVAATITRTAGDATTVSAELYRDGAGTDLIMGFFGEPFTGVVANPGPTYGPRLAGISSQQQAIPFSNEFAASKVYIQVRTEDGTTGTWQVKLRYIDTGVFT